MHLPPKQPHSRTANPPRPEPPRPEPHSRPEPRRRPEPRHEEMHPPPKQVERLASPSPRLPPPPPYPEISLLPVTTTQESQTSQQNSLLHGILTKAPASQTYSPTLAKLLTSPERRQALSPFGQAKSCGEITITPVQPAPPPAPDPQPEKPEEVVQLQDDEESPGSSGSGGGSPAGSGSGSGSGRLVIDEQAAAQPSPDDAPLCQGCRRRDAQFVCAGCANQWYCSRDCQVCTTLVWETTSGSGSGSGSGRLVIDEQAAAQPSPDDAPLCQGCRRRDAQFVCAGCANQWYCSRDCQVCATLVWETTSGSGSGSGSGRLVIDEQAAAQPSPDDAPLCQGCRRRDAQFVCAGCANQWYCSRDCQVCTTLVWETTSGSGSGSGSGRLVIDEQAAAQPSPDDAPLCQGCRRRDAQFVCAGCANQWYCSRDCQVCTTLVWETTSGSGSGSGSGRLVIDEQAAAQPSPDDAPLCQGCRRRDAQFVCAGCANQWYCSRDCQVCTTLVWETTSGSASGSGSGRLVIDEQAAAQPSPDDAPLCQGCRRRDAQFVCAGCANQWYCSRDCQVCTALVWETTSGSGSGSGSGRLVIDEQAAAQPSPDDAPLCQGCRRRDAQFVCAGCANQWYCSRDCQV
ncbi:uncharacterized protein LOC135075456 [Ostrinia nubilalis]|uniref:uncharacterized protein LOC135075456 n=1 Tax=Ostrinia nubilalis TaxID=29057 RepID=UPI0030822A8F